MLEFVTTTVRNHREETVCAYCGSPLYVGDTFRLADDGTAVCSRGCERSLHREYEEVNNG